MIGGMLAAAIILHLVILGATQAVLKWLADTLPRAKALAWQYAIAAGLVLVFAMMRGQLQFEPYLLLISLTGAVTAIGHMYSGKHMGIV